MRFLLLSSLFDVVVQEPDNPEGKHQNGYGILLYSIQTSYYEVNQEYLPEIKKGGLIVSGTSPDKKLVEFVEAPDCKFFVATQAHPEFKSRPLKPHPLFIGLIDTVLKRR